MRLSLLSDFLRSLVIDLVTSVGSCRLLRPTLLSFAFRCGFRSGVGACHIALLVTCYNCCLIVLLLGKISCLALFGHGLEGEYSSSWFLFFMPSLTDTVPNVFPFQFSSYRLVFSTGSQEFLSIYGVVRRIHHVDFGASSFRKLL